MDDEKFDSRIALDGECEIWTRALDSNGYPVFNEGTTKATAHRYAYQREYGTVPTTLLNLCGNRKCVNPQHYEPGRKSRGKPATRLTLRERIERKILRDGECWIWTGDISNRGKGRVWHDGKMRQTHRILWQLERGYEPGWLYRKCPNPDCVNPDHYQEKK